MNWKNASERLRYANRYALFALWMFVSIVGSTQVLLGSTDYRVVTKLLTYKDGLSHNTVHGVYQDSRNLYWIPARYGLNRFDGGYFELYTQEKNGLHSNTIDLAYEDRDPESTDPESGMIWLLSKDRNSFIWFIESNAFRYSIFNPYTQQVVDAKIYLGDELYHHLENLIAFERRDDHLLLLTETGYAIKYYHRDRVEITRLNPPLKRFFYYKALANKRYWVGHYKPPFEYLQLFSKDHEPVRKHRFCQFQGHACENPQVCMGDLKLIPTNNRGDSLWFTSLEGTSDLRALFCALPSGDIIDLPYAALVPDLPDDQMLDALFFDAEARQFWLTDKDAKTYIVDPRQGLIHTLDFPIEAVWLKDNQGVIWANSKHGLHLVQIQKTPFRKHLPGVAVRGMTVDDQNRIWAYPNSIEGEGTSLDSLRFNYSNILASHSLLKDAAGTIWSFCIRADQLFLGRFRSEDDGKGNLSPTGLAAQRTWSIYKDERTGLFWGGGEKGLLFSYDPATRATTKVSLINGIDAFKKATVYQIKPHGNRYFWLATSNGLYLMDKSRGLLARYWKEGPEGQRLPVNAVHHVHTDAEGTFWLGSRAKGLLQVAFEDAEKMEIPFKVQTLRQFTVADGLPSNGIHAIYENPAPDGYLWLNTENGIVQFHKSAHFSTNFALEDGIVHAEGNRIAHYQAEDGRIYFGTIAGVTSFHPKNFSRSPETDRSYIHVVGYEQYNAATQRMESRIDRFQADKKIILPAQEGRIELKLSQPFTLGVRNVFYTYQIEGLHPDPIALLRPRLTVSDVPYGKYTLILKAMNSKGELLDSRSIPLLSIAPFYLRWWFLLSLLLTGLGLAYFVIQYRTRVLIQQKVVLETEVRHRTQQLEADKIVIERQAKALRELDETKSRFFANVSHELRTPIQLIQGPIRSVLKTNTLDGKDSGLLLKAERSSETLLKLVDEILDLTKLDANKLDLYEESIVFYPFLRRVISNFQSIADAKFIDFTFVYHPRETLQLELDTDKFEKILNNLLSNALKFTAKGGAIQVTVENAASHLLLSVRDNGRGIPAADLPYIFDRFYQSATNIKAEGGLGIGLALSREFVTLMKGKLWVESETEGPNHGTCFYFRFLRKEVMSMVSTKDRLAIAEAGKPPVVAVREERTLVSAADRPTILLVEDNYDLKDYLQTLLSPYYHLLTADNGQEAMEVLAAIPGSQVRLPITEDTEPARFLPSGEASVVPVDKLPALIISDIMMPIMDGFEFLERVKGNPNLRSIPFIMLTARTQLRDKLKALRIGVDDYLLKPFKEEELLVRIENLLTNARERNQFAQDRKVSETIVADTLSGNTEAENQWLKEVEDLVLENLTDSRFSIDYLAALLGINRKTFYQKVKLLTGLTPNQLIRSIRLRRAKEGLEQNNYTSVKAAANDVGFLRPDYFSKLFVQAYGKAPIDYFK